MAVTIAQLNTDRAKGILTSSSYIRMCLSSTKTGNDAYTVDLTTILGVSEAERFAEIANLQKAGMIQASIPSSFTVNWTTPTALPVYTPDQVLDWKNNGMFKTKGYLYWILAAENPNKQASQTIDPARLRAYYGLTDQNIFTELANLAADKALTTNISNVTLKWLPNAKPITTSDSVTSLKAQIDALTAQLNQISASEVLNTDPRLADARPPLPHTQTIASIEGLQTVLDGKQPVGDYAPSNSFTLEASTTATLENNWARYSIATGNPAYYKDAFGMVTLTGYLKSGTLGTVAFHLPAGYRPIVQKTFQVFSGTNPSGTPTAAAVTVLTDGSVTILAGNNACIALDGIRFRTT